MMSLLAFLGLLAGQATPTTLTYTNNGARMEVILPELAKLTGLPLRVSPKLAEHVLILRLDHAPIQESLKRIAHTAYAQWIKEGNTYILYPDPDRISKALDAAKQERAQLIFAALSKITKPTKDDHPWYTNADTDPEAIQRHLSLRRMVSSALPSEDADAIANLREDGRLVFSTDPTALQLPLPPSSLAAFKTYIPEPPPPPPPGQTYQFSSFTRGPVPLAKDVVKVDVSVVNGGYVLLFNVSWIGKNHTQIYNDEFGNLIGDPYARWAKKPRQPKPLKASPEELEYLNPVNPANPKTSPALGTRLRSPQQNDPASLPGEVLVAYATEVKQQLVAAPSDDEIDDFYDAIPAIEYDEDSHKLTYDAGAKVGDGHGWIEVPEKIDDSYDEATAHRSRRRMAKGMAELPTVDGATLLDTIRAWRDGLGEVMDMPQARLYPSIAFLGGVREFYDLIQTLDDTEIAWLMNGGSFKLGSASPTFQAAFAEITSSQDAERIEGDMNQDRYDLQERLDPESFLFDDVKPPDEEPISPEKAPPSCEFTEWASAFAPPDTVVSLLSAEAPHIAVSVGPGKFPTPLNISYSISNKATGSSGGGSYSVDWNDAERDGYSFGQLAIVQSLVPSTVLLKVGTIHDYRLRMEFAQGLYFQRECDLTTFAPGAKYVKLDQLPEDLKQKLRDARAKITDFKLDQPDQGDGSTGTGPP